MSNSTQGNTQGKTSFGHVLKYTGLFGSVQGLSMLAGVVRTKVVALFLGPSGLALINLYNTMASLVSQCTNLGVSFSAVKDVAECHAAGDAAATTRSVESVRVWCMITALFGTAVCLMLSPLISWLTFGNHDYTLSIALLSPMVGMLAVTGGEMAILKGLKRLKRVAFVSMLAAVASVVVYIPLYALWGMAAIVPALLLCNLLIMAIHLYYATRVMPWHCPLFSRKALGRGVPFIKLGVAYIVSGAFGQGAEYAMRALLLRDGGMDVVGFYNCGYMLIVSYTSLVFLAVENDYYPRLSAVMHQRTLMNDAVNKQIEVCALLVSPVLVVFVLLMPFVVRLLFSAQFATAVGLSTCAVFYMFFRAFTLPAAYLPLAAGHSRTYMAMELIYDVALTAAVPVAYHYYGLNGTGWALSVMGLLDLLLIHGYYRYKYHYQFRCQAWHIYAVQFALLCGAVYAALELPLAPRCMVGAAVALASIWLSLHQLNKETGLVAKVMQRLKRGRTE